MTTSSARWPVVIFDLDGTLADTVGLIVASYQHAFRTHLGREVDAELIKSWIGRPLTQAFREYSPENWETLYATYLEWNTENTHRLIGSYEGISTMLEALTEAGVEVGIATSKRRESAQLAMEILNITPHIQTLVAMEDSELHKPDPTPLKLALSRLGKQPEDAVYIGDAVVDIVAGQAAGMSTIAVTWGAGVESDLQAAQPTAIARSAMELQQLLLG